MLENLTHKNIIKFYAWWFDARHQTLNFLTELFTSGTLRQCVAPGGWHAE